MAPVKSSVELFASTHNLRSPLPAAGQILLLIVLQNETHVGSGELAQAVRGLERADAAEDGPENAASDIDIYMI